MKIPFCEKVGVTGSRVGHGTGGKIRLILQIEWRIIEQTGCFLDSVLLRMRQLIALDDRLEFCLLSVFTWLYCKLHIHLYIFVDAKLYTQTSLMLLTFFSLLFLKYLYAPKNGMIFQLLYIMHNVISAGYTNW